MTRVLLADPLVLKPEDKGGAPKWMAVEFSQPVSMIGAEIVTVAGSVIAVQRSDETCELLVQGSNDLQRWFFVTQKTLPNTPKGFAYPDIRVSYAFVRLRYSIRIGALAGGSSWALRVELETAARGVVSD